MGWYKHSWNSLQFFFVSTEDIQKHESGLALEERYSSIKTIPGTRSHHSFVPISSDGMQMKRISADTVQSVIHLHGARVDPPSDFTRDNETAYQPGRYVACTYDSLRHIGNIVERSDANKDLLINFMERKEDTRLPTPRKADKCWVPFLHVLCTVDVPLAEGTSARQYRLSAIDFDRVVAMYNYSQ